VRRFLAASVLGVAGACGLPNSDEFTRAGSDAGSPPVDSSTDVHVSAADAQADAPIEAEAAAPHGPSLLTGNPSNFDSGTCDGAGNYQANLTGTTDAHTGPSACEVCRSVNDGLYTIDTYFFDDVVKAGARYTAHAWVKRPAGDTANDTVFIALRLSDANFQFIEDHEGNPQTLTDTWTEITFTTTFGQDGRKIDTYLGSIPAGGGNPCFIVDDYEVWKD
jgi:hypothetical protein